MLQKEIAQGSENLEVNVSHLAKGVYFATLVDQEGHRVQQLSWVKL